MDQMPSQHLMVGAAGTGYLHPDYAQSLAEFGVPREMPKCGGWILERVIPGYPDRDAMGCYPLFFCRDWGGLHLDLQDVGHGLVSVALVTDPFGAYDAELLRQCFDVVIPFKEHFVVDCCQPINQSVSKNHQYQARRALKEVRVEKCENPSVFLEEWVVLYDTLIKRHGLKGIHAFSKKAFETQLTISGMTMLRALHKGSTVGMLLAIEQGSVAYAHLAASSEAGYKVGSAYALFWCAIEHFIGRMRWFSIGARAGVSCNSGGGLDFFKQGWSTGTRTAYFCGRILDRERYAQIVTERLVPETKYFPAYRQGEFG